MVEAFLKADDYILTAGKDGWVNTSHRHLSVLAIWWCCSVSLYPCCFYVVQICSAENCSRYQKPLMTWWRTPNWTTTFFIVSCTRPTRPWQNPDTSCSDCTNETCTNVLVKPNLWTLQHSPREYVLKLFISREIGFLVFEMRKQDAYMCPYLKIEPSVFTDATSLLLCEVISSRRLPIVSPTFQCTKRKDLLSFSFRMTIAT